MDINEITEEIIGAGIEVHKALGPGLLESVYENCMAQEFYLRKLKFCRQVATPIEYKGVKIDASLRLDFVVENKVIVELKSVETLHSIYSVQLLTYLRILNHEVGLLMNFNVPILCEGIKRVVNNYNRNWTF